MLRRLIHRTIVLALAVGLAACGNDKPSTGNAAGSQATRPRTPADIDTATAQKLIAGGATVLDVRTADEFADGHLPSARNVPLDEIGMRLAEIEQSAGAKDRPVVVYCGSGARSAKAKAELEVAGFTHVVNGGGYRALSTP